MDGDRIIAVAVNPQNEPYVTGRTNSNDFPLSSNPFQQFNKGNSDVFVTKFNAQASAILYSTFVGGANIDLVRAAAVDANGMMYITGGTDSSDYPIRNAIQNSDGVGCAGSLWTFAISAPGSSRTPSRWIGANARSGSVSRAPSFRSPAITAPSPAPPPRRTSAPPYR